METGAYSLRRSCHGNDGSEEGIANLQNGF
jgi:hypothetical protein